MYSDLLLTVAVVASVVFFGALITRGNERQRRSIDKLHAAYKQWAMHDLRIKRGVAINQIKIVNCAGVIVESSCSRIGDDCMPGGHLRPNRKVQLVGFDGAPRRPTWLEP